VYLPISGAKALSDKLETRLNSTLSVRIEELNAQISTLYVENLRLRASEIALSAQLQREREKSWRIMTDAETAVRRITHSTSCPLTHSLPSRRTIWPNTWGTCAKRTISRITRLRLLNNPQHHHLAPADQCQTPPFRRRPLGSPAHQTFQGYMKMTKMVRLPLHQTRPKGLQARLSVAR